MGGGRGTVGGCLDGGGSMGGGGGSVGRGGVVGLEGGVWEVVGAGNKEACDHKILVQSITAPKFLAVS